jgi:hypothetical protein
MDESWEIRSGFERRCFVLCLCIWSFRSLGLDRVYICFFMAFQKRYKRDWDVDVE